MDFISSLLEYLSIAFKFEPALILSVALRTVVISIILLIVIKWIGSKGIGQLTSYQLVIILSLGNIVVEPMINSDTPILTMVSVTVIIVLIFKGLDYVSAKNRKMEKMINPEAIELVRNGQIDDSGLLRARIGIKEYESFMRLSGIRRVDEIDLSNLEINGQISFIKKENDREKHKQN